MLHNPMYDKSKQKRPRLIVHEASVCRSDGTKIYTSDTSVFICSIVEAENNTHTSLGWVLINMQCTGMQFYRGDAALS